MPTPKAGRSARWPTLAFAAVLSGCSIASSGAPSDAVPSTLGHSQGGRITHIVLLVQENRSFDDFFADFPGADGATQGEDSEGHIVPLKEVPLDERCDFGHSWKGFLRDYNHGKMNGFNLEGTSGECRGQAALRPYQFVNPANIRPYWDIAKQYVLADRMFQTQGSGSFTAHQDLIAGATAINQWESLVDYPSQAPWGCDAPKNPETATSLLKGPGITIHAPVRLNYLYHQGPFPCLEYRTLRDVLDAKSISWKYYSPPVVRGAGALWNAFDAIKAVRKGPEWATNVTSSNRKIFRDIKSGTLPAMSWLVPEVENSDHPGGHSDSGPSWVAGVVNAIGESAYWNSTAIVIVWDDWGGFYDHVAPPFRDNAGGLGFRVPMLVVSAYARRGKSGSGGYVDHTQYEFGSILRFVEDTFGLSRLGTTDERARSIGDALNLSQPPLTFTPISVKYSRSYFERQASSDAPVDTE